MVQKEIYDIRNLLRGHEIRISKMALELHKEQERVADMIRIIDTIILKENENGMVTE